jgi:hypothetical protein
MVLRPELAARVFNTPLLMHPGKLDAALAGIGERMVEGGVVLQTDTGLPREPRFKITRITPRRVDRSGELRLEIFGVYMPRGHLGDFTPEDMRTITLTQSANNSLQAV